MTGIPPQAITAAAVAIRQHWHTSVLDHPDVTRILAIAALEAAAPFLAEDGWDAARDRATEANDARRDERKRLLLAVRHTCACQPCKDAVASLTSEETPDAA